jgi:hypothetical protein
MKNPQSMELFEALNNLEKQVPNNLLSEKLILFFTVLNLKPEILIVGQLHYYAIWVNWVPEGFGSFVDKGLLVADDVHVADWGQDTDLVQGVLFLFGGQVDYFDTF